MATDTLDHNLIFNVNRQIKAKDTAIFRDKITYSDKNKRDFTQAKAVVDFSEKSNVHGTPSSFDLFDRKFLTVLNICFSKVRMWQKYNIRKPWLPDGLGKSITHMDNSYNTGSLRVSITKFYINLI